MIKQIIINELKSLMEREPDADELSSAIEYVKDVLDENSDLGAVSDALRDWVESECVECIWCGKHFMPDNINPDSRFCCDRCHDEYVEDEEFESQSQRELKSMWNER